MKNFRDNVRLYMSSSFKESLFLFLEDFRVEEGYLSIITLEGLVLKLKLQYFGHVMQTANSFEKTMMLAKIEVKRRGQQRMRWLDGTTNSNRHEFEQTEGDSEEQGSLVCYSSWGHKKLDTT